MPYLPKVHFAFVAALAAGGAISALAEPGPGERIIEGEWIVARMVRGGKPVQLPPHVKMGMAFRVSDHTWRFSLKTAEGDFSESGTWQLDGSMLVTRSEDGSKVERMRVRAVGQGAIELKKTDERLLLRRAR